MRSPKTWICAGIVVFLISVVFALADAVGLAASNLPEAVFGVVFVDACNGSGVTADGFTEFKPSSPCTRELSHFHIHTDMIAFSSARSSGDRLTEHCCVRGMSCFRGFLNIS